MNKKNYVRDPSAGQPIHRKWRLITISLHYRTPSGPPFTWLWNKKKPRGEPRCLHPTKERSDNKAHPKFSALLESTK